MYGIITNETFRQTNIQFLAHTHYMYLTKEHSVFMNGEIDREEPRGERSTESIPVHQRYLSADWLVFEEVFLGRDHVRKDLTMGLHDLRDGFVGDLGKKLKTVVRLCFCVCVCVCVCVCGEGGNVGVC